MVKLTHEVTWWVYVNSTIIAVVGFVLLFAALITSAALDSLIASIVLAAAVVSYVPVYAQLDKLLYRRIQRLMKDKGFFWYTVNHG